MGWKKSSLSSNGDCVEVYNEDDTVLVRDSKNRYGAILAFNKREWDAFIGGAKAGEFD